MSTSRVPLAVVPYSYLSALIQGNIQMHSFMKEICELKAQAAIKPLKRVDAAQLKLLTRTVESRMERAKELRDHTEASTNIAKEKYSQHYNA
jgi:tRNA A37 N6-isopentenylltransferase MiaA